MENATQKADGALRSVPRTELTVFTLEQAVLAVARARDEVKIVIEAKDAAETRAHAAESELAEEQRRTSDLKTRIEEIEAAPYLDKDELETLREDKKITVEMLGMSELEWDATRNFFDRAAHVAGIVRTRKARLIELVNRPESER